MKSESTAVHSLATNHLLQFWLVVQLNKPLIIILVDKQECYCKDGRGGKWLSNVCVRVCSAELSGKRISTYPVELTVIFRRINLYLEVALSGSSSGMIWMFSYSMGMPRTHTRLVVWFSNALIALRVNIYDRKRLTEVIIAQSLNMHRSGSRV